MTGSENTAAVARRRVPWRVWLGAVYTVGVGAYMMDGVDNGRGFGGLLLDWMLRLFDSVSPATIGSVGLLVLAVPVWVVLFATAPEPLAGAVAPPRSIAREWLTVIGIALLLGGPPGLWYWAEASADAADMQRRVYELDFTRSPELPAPDATIVTMTGYVVVAESPEFSQSLQGGGLKSSTIYVPLVGPTWQPGDAVTYVVDSSFNPQYFPTAFAGRLERNGLPRHVRTALANVEVELSDPYYFVHEVKVENGKLVATDREFTYLFWISAVLTTLVLVIGSVVIYMRGDAPPAKPAVS